MTDIKITRDNNMSVISVECKGHTDYAVQGEDIVCAGLSTLVQSALLGLLQVAGINVDYQRQADDGYLRFTLPDNLTHQQRHDADVILNTMLCALNDFYTEYSDYIYLEVI